MNQFESTIHHMRAKDNRNPDNLLLHPLVFL